MTQVIGPPIYTAEMLGKAKLSKEQLNARNSLDNNYRKALGNITDLGVRLYVGSAQRTLAATDLMVVLRDCKQRLSQNAGLSDTDYAFFIHMLRKFAKTNYIICIGIKALLRLRAIAYGKSEPRPDEVVEVAKKKALLRHRRFHSYQARTPSPKVSASPMSGCSYQDPNSGDRCGAPAEGNRCEAHKGLDGAYNGRGSMFYATNPNRKSVARR